jgi:hypothetical protein
MTVNPFSKSLNSSSSLSQVLVLGLEQVHDDRRSHTKHGLDRDPISERGGVWRVVAT